MGLGPPDVSDWATQSSSVCRDNIGVLTRQKEPGDRAPLKSIYHLKQTFLFLHVTSTFPSFVFTALMSVSCLSGSLYLQPSLRSLSLRRSPTRSFTSLSRPCRTSVFHSHLRPSWAPSRPRSAPPQQQRARHRGCFTLSSLQGKTA